MGELQSRTYSGAAGNDPKGALQLTVQQQDELQSGRIELLHLCQVKGGVPIGNGGEQRRLQFRGRVHRHVTGYRDNAGLGFDGKLHGQAMTSLETASNMTAGWKGLVIQAL